MYARHHLWQWLGIVSALILFALTVWSPSTFADGPIHVRRNEHEFAFGRWVRFRLEVEDDNPLDSIVLAYRTSDTQGTSVARVNFVSRTVVTAEHVHEIARRYIPPFVRVTYWWTITDVAGNRLSTTPRSFLYADDRFTWQSLDGGAVRVHWYRGDLQIAQRSLDLALKGLERARQDIPIAGLSRPIEVYFYANPTDWRTAVPGGTPAGMEALTFYETNGILVSFGPEPANIPRLQRVLPHEVTHALLHEAVPGSFDRLPMWLEEGLATSVQYSFAPDPQGQELLEKALRNGQWLPLESLCASFPHSTPQNHLAYAESASLINYIRDAYGRQKLRDLVAAYADGATCAGGVHRVLGISLDRLETHWRASVEPKGGWAAFWQDNGAWVALLVIVTVGPLVLTPVTSHRRRTTRQE